MEHVEEHDLTTDDVDYVMEHYTSTGKSRSSNRDAVYGYTPDGRYIVVIYEEIDQDTVAGLRVRSPRTVAAVIHFRPWRRNHYSM